MLAGHMVARGRIELVDAPEPELGPTPTDGPAEIIFEPHWTCLCGSDLPYFDSPDEADYPQKVGHSLHEMIGRVVATNGKRFSEGDRVLAVPVEQIGLFERFAVAEDRVIPLDDRPSPEHALLAQPLGTVIYALKKLPHLLDLDVAVVGQGPIGQLFCLALRNLGARNIIGVDKLQSRLDRSLAIGATATVCNATEDPLEAVRDILDGELPDLVIEAVGHHDQALNLCVDLSRLHGRILYFGVPPQQIDNVHWRNLFLKNLTVHTSVNPDFRRDFPLAMRWIGEGRVDVSQLITHRYPLAEVQTAFDTFRDRKEGALKVLLEFPVGG